MSDIRNGPPPSSFAVARCDNGFLVHLTWDKPKRKRQQQVAGLWSMYCVDDACEPEPETRPLVARNLFEVALILEQAFGEPIFTGKIVADLTEPEAEVMVARRRPRRKEPVSG